MYKIWTIAWKELYTTFTDRNLILIMIATPLLISTIIGVVFGGLGGDGNMTFSDIPVAVVNMDTGTEQRGQQVNYGQNLVGLLVVPSQEEGETSNQPTCSLAGEGQSDEGQPNVRLDALFDAVALDDATAAREGVDGGDYVAAIIVPADFSERVSPDISSGGPEAGIDPAAIEVYADSARTISASIVRSVVEGFTNQILTGNVAVSASVASLVEFNPLSAMQLGVNEDAQAVFSCGFSDALSTVGISRQPISGDQTSNLSVVSQILVFVGSAQAVFFALFTGQFSVISIVEERRQGTLQRLIVSPTPRYAILAGKLMGTFVTVVFQIGILLAALTLVASIIEGELTLIWGTNFPGIVLTVLLLAFCVSGIGVLVAGVAKTPEQVGTFGTVVNFAIAMPGGAFGFTLPSPIRETSLVYWGVDAFNSLATGEGDIGLNLVVLLAMGVIVFFAGLWLFNRRVEV